MKTINRSVLFTIFSLILGCLLIVWSAEAGKLTVIIIGTLFLGAGLTSFFNFMLESRSKERELKPMFPFDALGSTFLGLWMMLDPLFFVQVLMYLLGGILVMAGFFELYSLYQVTKRQVVPSYFYISPVLILGGGLLSILYPFEVATTPFILCGVLCVLFSVSRLVSWFRFRKRIG